MKLAKGVIAARRHNLASALKLGDGLSVIEHFVARGYEQGDSVGATR